MAKQVLRTSDSQVWLGWPTEDTGDAYVQLGVIHGDNSAWAELNEAAIDRLRRDLQRAKRRVYGRSDDLAALAATRDRIAEQEAAANEKLAKTRDSLVSCASSLLDQTLDRLAWGRAQQGQIERPQL